jgi:hypothetical protein
LPRIDRLPLDDVNMAVEEPGPPKPPPVAAATADRCPANVIHQWVTTDQLSIHAIQRSGKDGKLRILIEKDFERLEASSEESQEDAFPHPHQSEEHSDAS